MIKMTDVGTSSVVVILYDKCKNQINPSFTWQIVNSTTLDNIIFTADDISSAPNIYNKFQFVVGTNSLGLTAGIIPVKVGQWSYTVYEMPAPYDLNLNNNIGVCNVGDLIVTGVEVVPHPSFPTIATASRFNPIVSPYPSFTG